MAAWREYRDYGTPPVSGGYLEWPESIRDDFDILDMTETFHQLQAEKAQTPQAGFFDIFKRGRK